ncbi:pyridoxal-dependent decarboxylase, exosortase A system-associated [Sphingomonas sp. NSE70-1]|uniref:Pyridoxal-dependent decarboxylase, exosortase A system-associated n=1 Tax=Sphingomonas caseinilyticus TaxID=2908205 RepID=A0ABT0RRW2_9SPHN|nr:pyridoxal-dependent decarboxylase, exosortase A system-associated [Sphingomonas caseinilyticus]MCL6697747.1 pyridoxal-dependent decarboxylase, exosortase A system-associated [Sphingomonas caseinilyticus]
MKALGPIPAGYEADGDGRLTIGGWDAEMLVNEAGGTPLFVYDSRRIADQVSRFRAAFPGVALHYAVKANPYAPLLEAMAVLVDGFDTASAGELGKVAHLALPISFAGPGKRDQELETAIRAGITVNLESEGEADRALAIAQREGLTPKLAVRVNPPFGLKGSGQKMGGLPSQFGVDHDRAPALVRRLIEAGADWRGLHIFAGSQALHADALIELQHDTVALAASIAEEAGHPPPEVNLGGGFGIPYFAKDQPLNVEAVGDALAKTLAGRPKILADTQFAIELGRWLVGEAGVYLTRIIARKESRGRTFHVTDGGLQHQLAASGNFGQLLRRNYPVAIAGRFGSAADEEVTITGCLCTPLDLLADEAMLPRAEVGDLVAIFCAGAYGLSASPTAFLSQPMAREMLI